VLERIWKETKISTFRTWLQYFFYKLETALVEMRLCKGAAERKELVDY
jgi:hypothetical protein